MILAPVLLECLLAARSAFQSQQSLPIPNHGVLVEIVKMTGCAGGRSRAEEMLRTSLLLALLGKRRCLMLPLDSCISLTYFFLGFPWQTWLAHVNRPEALAPWAPCSSLVWSSPCSHLKHGEVKQTGISVGQLIFILCYTSYTHSYQYDTW